MKNHHDLHQLKRDALKPGAWQAKLAYAQYLLEYEPVQSEEAQRYLQEIIDNDIRTYITEARYLHESHFPADGKPNAIAIASLEKEKFANHHSSSLPDFKRKISDSPEFQYKQIRYYYNHPSVHKDEKEKLINQTIQKLESLLKLKAEITDTLRAKIYFQLIHMNMEYSKLKGQRNHLDEAKKYCHLLMKNETTSEMNKAKYAEKIHEQIEKITATPIYDFATHMKESFNAGKNGNRILFKYIGIGIGNILDLALLGMPKIFSKSVQRDNDNYVRKGKTFPEEFIKNSGLAAPFKYLGKKFGEHIVGNLIGGPITAVIGAITYPFEYLHQKYRENKQISKLANDVLSTSRETNDILSTHSIHNSLDSNVKSIFSGNKENSQYDKRIDYTTIELNNSVSVKNSPQLASKNGGTAYAYGSVFSRVKPVINDNPSPLVPVYSILNRN